MKLVEKRDYNSIFYALALLIFFLFLSFTIGGEDGLIKLYQLDQIAQDFETKNKKLLEENIAFRQEIQEFNNLDAIEKRVKSSLGLVKPNEVIYLLP